MTLQTRTALNLFAGALAGVLAWVLIDLSGWFYSILYNVTVVHPGSGAWWLQIAIGAILGGMVGLLLGLVDALALDSGTQRLRSLLVNCAVGIAGGMLGIYFGQLAFAILAPADIAVATHASSPFEFIQAIVARSIGWALIGLGIGVAQGVARQSTILARQGAFGGLVGGFVGGVLFEVLTPIIQLPALGRLVGFVSIGAATGFFIGLIQTLFKQAWIRVLVGRNEGKEYLIAKPVTTIGRSELADVGLFGDARIAPTHCAVEQAGDRYRLRHVAGTEPGQSQDKFAPTLINGMQVWPDVWLADGDNIVLAKRTLQFRERLKQRAIANPKPALQSSPPPKPLETFTLTSESGGLIGRVFPLGPSALEIGRAPECVVSIPGDTAVSRHHARIESFGPGWRVVDENSANGTYINERRIESGQSQSLNTGDRVRIGETVLRFDRQVK